MMLLTALLVASTQIHEVWSHGTFRADPTGPPNHVAQLAWAVRKNGTVGEVKLSFYTANEPKSHLDTCTIVGKGFHATGVEVYTLFPPKMNPKIKYFGTPYVVAAVTMRQGTRTIVWQVDGHSRRPVQEQVLFPCDTTRLASSGILIERTVASRLTRTERPDGLQSKAPVHRAWTFDGMRFIAARWHLTKRTPPHLRSEAK